MEIILERLESTDHGTFGKFILGELTFYTLELPWLENKRGISCIPNGEYECFLRHSGKFGKCYEVKDVPGRSGILIHRGNYGGNKSKGFKSDIEGCILLGKSTGVIKGQKCVLNSRKAVEEFMFLLNGQSFTLIIR